MGRTVFEGNNVQEFQVDILGVLKNALAPKHDVILARLSGGPLATTGVIAGMSGSPVYVDGKLLGAVALAFPFSKEPLAGITPIQDMLDVVPEPPPSADASAREQQAATGFTLPYTIVSDTADPQGSLRLIPGNADDQPILQQLERLLPSQNLNSAFTGMDLPLRFAGFSSQAMDAYAPLFRRMGFEPMQGGVLSSGESGPPSKQGPQPGAMISLMLVRGDFDLNVDCTVTLREGNRLFACGHRFLMTGPAEIPFAEARVLTTVPSLATSFKVDAPGPLAGTIRQDRFGAIYGVVGERTPTIPVHIHLASTLNRNADYRFEIVQQPFLSPLLLNLSVVSALTGTERAIGPSTLRIQGAIHLSDGEAVNLDNVVSGDVNTANIAGVEISMPLTYLLESNFPDTRITGVDLSVASSDEKRIATVEQVWSSAPEVRPGDHIMVTALLRTPSGKTVIEKIPVDIPVSVNDKMISLVVGGGSALNMIQNRMSPLATGPRDLHQLVHALNRMRRDNRLYALLMSPQRSLTLQGDEYPSPPPSLLQTFLADPAVSSSVMFSGTSVVGDFQTKPTRYSIQGQKTLQLKVESPGA